MWPSEIQILRVLVTSFQTARPRASHTGLVSAPNTSSLLLHGKLCTLLPLLGMHFPKMFLSLAVLLLQILV